MALDITTARQDVAKLYIAAFDRVPDSAGLDYWVNSYMAGTNTLASLAQRFTESAEYKAAYPTYLTNTEYVERIYLNVFNRAADAGGSAYWAGEMAAGRLTNASLMKAMVDVASTNGSTDGQMLANQASFGVWAAVNQVPFATANAQLSSITSVESTLTAAQTAVSGSIGQTIGQAFTLTLGSDTFNGTSGNDTFNGAETTAATWTVGDAIDGGSGNDTLNIILTAAITKPTAATVVNVETVNATSGAGVTLDTTGFTGLTTLKTTSVAATNVTAAATTNVTAIETGVSAVDYALQINGGKDITITATGTTDDNEGLTAATGVGAEIIVGGTTEAAGKVTITSSFKGATTEDAADIFVKGGTEVSITQHVTNSTVNETNVQGEVSVVGGASTTKVTVVQDATAAASATGLGVVGKTAGAVTVTDKNATSNTVAGTIAEVTLTNAGAATVNSGALSTLNLGGTLVTVDASTSGALTTAAVTALALNLTGAVSTGAVSIDSDIKTLNVTGSTTASTIASLVASGATTINVAGDAKVTFTANTTGAVTAINVTNTAGASFGTAIGASTAFAGGAGDDAVKLTASFTKAITMGAGNDTVTYAAQGTGGSVAAGDGTDIIKMAVAEAASADDNETFNTKFTGFETLTLTDSATATLDLSGLNAVSTVNLDAAVHASGLTLNNLVSGGTVKVTTDAAGTLTVGVKDALTNPSDVLNLNLSKTGGVLAAGTIVAANVNTINITANDAAVAPTPGSTANINTMVLQATAAKTITVAGNNGLTLTNTGNTAVTLFDASGVVANNTVDSAGYAATTDSAASLAVTFASANTTADAAVTIKGGAGNDTLSGTATALDTISGGAGADKIYGDNAGTKEVQTVTITYAASETDVLTVNGIAVSYATGGDVNASTLALTNAINAQAELAGIVSAVNTGGGVVTLNWLVDGDQIVSVDTTSAANTQTVATTTAGTAGATKADVLDGGAGADILVGGGGADSITTGTGADTVFMLKAHSVLATMATITDYTYAVGGTSNDKLILGDIAAVIGTKTTVQDHSAQATLAAAMDAAALANTIDNGLTVFIYGGNEYAFVETTGATGTYVATDFVVKLTGLPLAAGAAVAGAGFDAI